MYVEFVNDISTSTTTLYKKYVICIKKKNYLITYSYLHCSVTREMIF